MLNYITPFQVYLFKQNESKFSFGGSELKTFLYYLKSMGIYNPSFSYSNTSFVHGPNDTVKDYFLLETSSKNQMTYNDANLNSKIKNIKNTNLSKLLKMIPDLESQLHSLSTFEKQLICIIKTILSESEYIFLNYPEKENNKETITLIKNSLLYEVKNFNRKVLINSTAPEQWLDLATKIVSKTKQTKFKTEENTLSTVKNDLIVTNVKSISKSLLKKVI